MPRSNVQFGTEQFVTATARDEGVPDHAAMIEGRLIHLGVKNLKDWGVTEAAADQIIDGIRGIPIRACNSADPHACDYDSDNSANVGYATRAWIDDGWLMAAAAITDKDAATKIDDQTWMPFGQGGWSVTGFPSDPTPDFETSGLTNSFSPASIALIIGNGEPAFEGSGFEMVAAAIQNYDHRGDTMDEKGGDPVTYTQEELDQKVADALEKQKADDAEAAKKAADAESEKTKAEHDAKIADMTSKDDLEAILAAHATKVQADTLDTINRAKLMEDYEEVVRSSPVVGAPFMGADGVLDQSLLDAEMQTVGGMQTAAIAGMVSKAKMVVAAVPGNQFTELEIPGTPAGSSQEAAELAICERMG